MIETKRLPCFLADKNGTNQTGFSANVWTQVTFSTERYDIGSYFASNAWTPPAGKIILSANVGNAGTASAGTTAGAAFYKNGSAFAVFWINQPANNGFMSIDCMDVANGSDAYTLYGYNGAGASRQFAGSIDATFFSGHWISP